MTLSATILCNSTVRTCCFKRQLITAWWWIVLTLSECKMPAVWAVQVCYYRHKRSDVCAKLLQNTQLGNKCKDSIPY